MTCTPPPDVKPYSWHRLLRGDDQCLARYSPELGWTFMAPRLDGRATVITTCSVGAATAAGWRYAGPAPELPKPQTAQEIAREALEPFRNAYLPMVDNETTGKVATLINALRRIAEMEPKP